MATLATVPDLEVYLGRTLDGAAATSASLALRGATAKIQRYTGQVLFAVTNDVYTVRPRGGVVCLPQLPVTAVDSVVSGVTPVEYMQLPNGVLEITGAWTDTVTVQYDHGYATIPDDVIEACCLLAAERLDNPDGFRRESVGSYSYDRGDVTSEARRPLEYYRARLLA